MNLFISCKRVFNPKRTSAKWIRRKSDYIMGFVTSAIGPSKSKKFTWLKSRYAIHAAKFEWKTTYMTLQTTNYCLWSHVCCFSFTLCRVKPCMLFFIQTLPRILCTDAISHVSFFDLFGPIAVVTNPIMQSLLRRIYTKTLMTSWFCLDTTLAIIKLLFTFDCRAAHPTPALKLPAMKKGRSLTRLF